MGMAGIFPRQVGSYLLRHAGLIQSQNNETKYGGNIVGGLIFGVGFGLLAYCPGTNAAAVGQGNLDALLGVAGMLIGSYLSALSSRFSNGSIRSWGQRGKPTLPDLMGVSTGVFVAFFVSSLFVVLLLIETQLT